MKNVCMPRGPAVPRPPAPPAERAGTWPAGVFARDAILAAIFGTGRGPRKDEMSWFFLLVAGLLEVAWAVGLKYTEGFTRLWPSVWTLTAMAGSVGMLGLALRHLPLGTAYAVWTGIGTIGTAAFGMLVLNEPAGALRIGSIGLIALGIAGLKLLTPA